MWIIQVLYIFQHSCRAGFYAISTVVASFLSFAPNDTTTSLNTNWVRYQRISLYIALIIVVTVLPKELYKKLHRIDWVRLGASARVLKILICWGTKCVIICGALNKPLPRVSFWRYDETCESQTLSLEATRPPCVSVQLCLMLISL